MSSLRELQDQFARGVLAHDERILAAIVPNGPLALLARALDAAQPVFAPATRWYVSWQFLKSGWLKLTSWSTTVSLFTDEYKVPLLPPTLAAIIGTFGELFFPILLIVGVAARIGAIGLFAVNAMAVISYAHVHCRRAAGRRPHAALALAKSFCQRVCVAE